MLKNTFYSGLVSDSERLDFLVGRSLNSHIHMFFRARAGPVAQRSFLLYNNS